MRQQQKQQPVHVGQQASSMGANPAETGSTGHQISCSCTTDYDYDGSSTQTQATGQLVGHITRVGVCAAIAQQLLSFDPAHLQLLPTLCR